MSKIWSFGDSFAEGQCSDVVNESGDSLLDKTYAHYFAERIYINNIETSAQGGSSLLDICGRILSKIGKVKKDDYVFILKTDSMRLTILPVKIDNTDLMHPIDKTSIQDSGTINYIAPLNVSSDIISKKDYKNYNGILSNVELDVIREFYLNIFLKYRKNYTNYFTDFFDSAINSLKDITDKVCIIDSSIWSNKLDYMALEYFGNDDDLYCSCGHWKPKLHEIVSILIQTAIENNELYITSKNCDTLWVSAKERLKI